MHNELPSYGQAPAGAIRFNTDSNKLEVYIGGPVGYGTLPNGQWMQVDNWSPENQTGGTRGVFGGGDTVPATGLSDRIDYVNIDTTGNAIDFGNLYTGRGPGGTSSRTRGLFFGGYAPTNSTNIHFVTIASKGDSTLFGNMTVAKTYPTGLSNGTRGIMLGGYNLQNTIDYVTIASTGDAVDFGDAINKRGGGAAGSQSSTRGLFAGGYTPTTLSSIEFITMSTLGNGANFGDLTSARSALQGDSNSVRGIFASGSGTNIIDYVTISTLGDAIDFGDLSGTNQAPGVAASPTRAVINGGNNFGATMEYVQIMSTGNSIDFGDNTQARQQIGACSNGHGGL